jgi:hypothetical protein
MMGYFTSGLPKVSFTPEIEPQPDAPTINHGLSIVTLAFLRLSRGLRLYY